MSSTMNSGQFTGTQAHFVDWGLAKAAGKGADHGKPDARTAAIIVSFFFSCLTEALFILVDNSYLVPKWLKGRSWCHSMSAEDVKLSV